MNRINVAIRAHSAREFTTIRCWQPVKAEPGVNDKMNKLAHAVVEEPTSDNLQEDERLYLKKKKEQEIRMKLDAFAKELSDMREKRKKH
ncbi:MAG: hypothetical protein PsegKO_35010 [Pseudohongiellaceae bacterium]|jgi:hypothetical protein